MANKSLYRRLLASGLLMRAIYMVFFFLMASALRSATTMIAVLQFFNMFFQHKQSQILAKISRKLCAYGHDVDSYLLFNTEKNLFLFNQYDFNLTCWPRFSGNG
jgi:hypothetical protein